MQRLHNVPRRHPGPHRLVAAALIFIAGTIAGCEMSLQVLRVQDRLWPVLGGASFAAALVVIARAIWHGADMPPSLRVFGGRDDHQMPTICSYCHRVMGEDGKWSAVESWLFRHFEVRVSHGVCPACSKAAGEDNSV